MELLNRIRAKKKCIRAAVYARFSSDNQREESIDAQLRAIHEYAEKNDIRIVCEYVDKAKSAMTGNRPEFLRMIEESKGEIFDIVLVHKLDRFARNRQDSIGYRMELKRHGVTLISILEYIDESPESIILESMLEAMAEYYSKNLAREVNKGMRENALKGLHTGGLPPLGYDVNRTTKKLMINEREAEAVRLMFRMFIEGQGYGKIIDELNLRGYKTKTGRSFGKNSIHEILRNEKYIGNYIFNRLSAKDVDGKRNNHAYKEPEEVIRLENAVLPLVTREEFDQVQAKMARRKKARASNSAKEIYLLSGKIFCGECGYGMGGNRKLSGKNKTLHVSYRCSGRKNKHICNNKDIRREYIEAFVLDKLSQYVFDDSLIPKIAAAANTYLHETNTEVVGKKEAIGKRIIELTKEISNLVTLVAKYASEEIAARIPELEKERGHQEFEYKQICDSNDIPDITIDSIRTKFELARTYLKAGKLQTTQKLIEIFIKEVILYEDHVEVFFNFHPDLKPPTHESLITKQVRDSIPCVETEKDLRYTKIAGDDGIKGGWGKTPPASTMQNSTKG